MYINRQLNELLENREAFQFLTKANAFIRLQIEFVLQAITLSLSLSFSLDRFLRLIECNALSFVGVSILQKTNHDALTVYIFATTNLP